MSDVTINVTVTQGGTIDADLEAATAINVSVEEGGTLEAEIHGGGKGEQGDPGAAATIEVGTVTTVAPGDPATVTNVGTSSAAEFDFGIPQGEQGETGEGVPDGGTTAQVLRKASNADQDTEWHTPVKADVGLANADNTSDANKPVSTAQAAAIAVVQSDINAHEADTANPHAVTKAQVGLGNATNTSDADKPVSTAQQAAIDTVQDNLDAHEADTANPHSVTKAQVGLANADNTSDANKPVSTATQTALDAKVTGPASVTDDLPAVFDTTTGKLIKQKTYAAFKTLLALVKGDVGLGNVDNTSDANKPVSTAQQTALDAKVTGPASATDLAIAIFDSTTGKLVKNSVVQVDSSGNMTLATSDSGGLGSAVKMWADLFIASGGVINFNNGDVTLTHSSNLLTFSGGSLDMNGNNIISINALTMATGGALRTSTSSGNTLLLRAYDVDGATYITFATLTAGNTPTMDLDDAVTKAGQYLYRAGGTDVPVTDGGTGSSTAGGARTNLGLGALAVLNSVTEAEITLADNTTNDFSTTKHGFVPKGPNTGKFLKDNGTWDSIPGGGDALTSNPLSQFAATTSLQLKNTMSDETGSGALVFANSPALVTPTGIVKGDVGLGNVDNTSDATKQAAALLAAFPVGAIYINTSNTNPGTFIGGTWVAFGAGRVPVGFDSGQTEFDTDEETGGAKTVTLTAAEMPAHVHQILGRAGSSALDHTATAGYYARTTTASGSASNSDSQSTGGGGAHNNLQPYIVVRMWKRTA